MELSTTEKAQESAPKRLAGVITVNEQQITDHLGEVVRGTVEQTLNSLLDAEADALCGIRRYERSEERMDTRAGHYERKLHTLAKPGDAEGFPKCAVCR